MLATEFAGMDEEACLRRIQAAIARKATPHSQSSLPRLSARPASPGPSISPLAPTVRPYNSAVSVEWVIPAVPLDCAIPVDPVIPTFAVIPTVLAIPLDSVIPSYSVIPAASVEWVIPAVSLDCVIPVDPVIPIFAVIPVDPVIATFAVTPPLSVIYTTLRTPLMLPRRSVPERIRHERLPGISVYTGNSILDDLLIQDKHGDTLSKHLLTSDHPSERPSNRPSDHPSERPSDCPSNRPSDHP
jgi:hypothetical protein